jgi:histidinol-phosphate aminotransferase
MSPGPRRPSVRSDLALMEGYHSAQVDVAVRLNTNESPFPPPPGFADRLARAVHEAAWHRYPDRGAKALRAAIARLHGVEPAMAFAANGSNEVLQTVLLTFAGPGRTVVTFEPTYALHSHIARISGAAVATGRRDAQFALDLAEVDRVIDGYDPAVVFLCSPNNPTGVAEGRDLVIACAARCAAEGRLLVVDEAYGQFAPWSAQELVDGDAPVAITRTFSKTWSMAAARLGYLVGPPWLVASLDEVVLPYHLDVLKQAAGIIALDYVEDMESRVATIVAERERISAALAALPVTVWPSSANFVLFRPESRPGDDVWHELVARSVLVRNCASWPGLEGCLRVTVGSPVENEAFLSAMGEVLA